MNTLRNIEAYQILIRQSVAESKFLEETFKIEKNRIDNHELFALKIKYLPEEIIRIQKEIFDPNSSPQIFHLKTEEEIFNFIDFSHFTAGLKLAMSLNRDEKIDFIDKVRKLNLDFNKPTNLIKPIFFVLMVNPEICKTKMAEYNLKYKTDFRIVENYNLEGEEFCVIRLNSGNALDLFCFGLYFMLSQKKGS